MGFIQRIKDMWTLSQRITLVENELNELDKRLEQAVANYSKQFEKKIQDMTFAYTKNLDDTKSDYLKRYLEQRLDGMQYDISSLPQRIIAQISDDFNHKLELLSRDSDNDDDDTEHD